MTYLPLIIVFCLSLIFIHIIHASSNLLLLPVAKDPTNHQFTTLTHHRLQPIKPVVDLGGPSLWVHDSSSHHLNLLLRCSIQCTNANSNADHLSDKTAACHVENCNDIIGVRSNGQLVEAPVAVRSIDRSTATVDCFIFSCGSTLMWNGLTSGALGMIGLGGRKRQISLTAQFAAAFGFRRRRFVICFRNSDVGVLTFGDSLVESVFGTEISRSLLYTPLVASSSPSDAGYFINLKSIIIDDEY